ncbi:MAG: glycosyltransferase family 2 protein [Bacteroidia bacterium]
MISPLKISIITVCFNSEATIEETLKSVISQDYPNIEYIVIDGKSTDATLFIIEKYRNNIQKFISEKDEGLYFAINKGIEMASGEVIGILHSDDFYMNKNVLTKVMKLFTETQSDSVYGDLQYIDNVSNKIIRHWKAGHYSENLFLKGWMPPHPSFFVLKKIFFQYGFFNTIFQSAADYELMLRFLHKHKISTHYLPEVLVKMRVGGKSNASFINRIKANKEDRFAWKINNLQPNFLTLWLKPFSKIKQFFGQ